VFHAVSTSREVSDTPLALFYMLFVLYSNMGLGTSNTSSPLRSRKHSLWISSPPWRNFAELFSNGSPRRIWRRVPANNDLQHLHHGHPKRSTKTSSIVPSRPYLETVSAYQASGRAMADESISGFRVLNGAWNFSGMGTGSKNIAIDSCLVGGTTDGSREVP
jgi:hypothetical protein